MKKQRQKFSEFFPLTFFHFWAGRPGTYFRLHAKFSWKQSAVNINIMELKFCFWSWGTENFRWRICNLWNRSFSPYICFIRLPDLGPQTDKMTQNKGQRDNLLLTLFVALSCDKITWAWSTPPIPPPLLLAWGGFRHCYIHNKPNSWVLLSK